MGEGSFVGSVGLWDFPSQPTRPHSPKTLQLLTTHRPSQPQSPQPLQPHSHAALTTALTAHRALSAPQPHSPPNTTATQPSQLTSPHNPTAMQPSPPHSPHRPTALTAPQPSQPYSHSASRPNQPMQFQSPTGSTTRQCLSSAPTTLNRKHFDRRHLNTASPRPGPVSYLRLLRPAPCPATQHSVLPPPSGCEVGLSGEEGALGDDEGGVGCAAA